MIFGRKSHDDTYSMVNVFADFFMVHEHCLHFTFKRLTQDHTILIDIISEPEMKFRKLQKNWKINSAVVTIFPEFNVINYYRRAPILINVANIFEIIVEKRIYLSANVLISVSQNGFMTSRSTISNLAILTQYIYKENILQKCTTYYLVVCFIQEKLEVFNICEIVDD